MKLDEFISLLRSILLKEGNIDLYITPHSVSSLYTALDKDLDVYIAISALPKD